MVQPQLTNGAVLALTTYDDTSMVVAPTLQVLSVKKLPTAPGAAPSSDRYRTILSDGVHYLQGMLATQLNALVESGQLTRDTVLRLKKFVTNSVQQRRVTILLEVEVLGTVPKIGNPSNVDEAVAKGMVAPPATAANAAPAVQSAYQQPQRPTSPQARAPYGNAAPSTAHHATASNPNPIADADVFPISNLNPYNNRWTIKARVSNKSDVRTWSNNRGEGKLFSVTLIDEGGEIKATAFNDGVDRFYPLFEEGKVYYISKAAVKIAKKQFSNVKNDYELSFDNNTQVIPCEDDASSVPTVRFSFVSIKELMSIEKDTYIDVVGVVKECQDLQTIVSKTNQRQIPKRDVTLVDQSNTAVKLTLWGNTAETFDGSTHPVVALKGVRLSDYGGRSLSTVGSTTITINPDISEAHTLRGWYDSMGANAQTNSISTAGGSGAGKSDVRKTIAAIKDENLGQGEKPDYLSVKATVAFAKSEGTLWYTACPAEGCNKKVTQEGAHWRCEKCQRTYNYCDYRYVLSLNVNDETGSAWLSCFNDTAEMILGHKAVELNQMKETDNEAAFKAVFDEAVFKQYIFRLRAKMEIYNEEPKVKLQVMDVQPINYVSESKHLADLIEQYQ